MSGKAERLGRLAAIRRLREELDKSQLELAVAAVAEVETAIAAQVATLHRARSTARLALDNGERADWLLADAEGEVAGWNRRRLEVLLAARAALVVPAREQFLESRREHEQVKLLVEAFEQAERVDAGRRQQAEADDWFLVRMLRRRVAATDRR